MKKVVVVIDGGNVQSVFADEPGDVVVVDHDNLEEEGASRNQRLAVEAFETFGLQEIPISSATPVDPEVGG